MAAAVSLKDERMITMAESWLDGDKSFRPLRFMSGVENGVIGCEISQVNVAQGEDGAVQIVHIMSAVKPGKAQEAGVRPMDILLEVDGKEVSGQPIDVVRTFLQTASEEHSGEFALTVGRVLEGNESSKGWGQFFDQQHMKYYYNSETLQSAWKVPTMDLPHPWVKVVEEDGGVTYMNTKTEEKTDVRPMATISEDDQPVLCAGWLVKRRSKNAAWKQRWVTVMRNGMISWAKSQADEPLGSSTLAHTSFVAGVAHDGTGRNAKELHTITLTFEIEDQKGQKTMELASESADLSEKFQIAFRSAITLAEEEGHDFLDHYQDSSNSAQAGKQKASAAAESKRWAAASGGNRMSFDGDSAYDEAPYNARIDHQGWFKKKGMSFMTTMKQRYALLQGRNIRYFENDMAASNFHENGGTGYKGDVIVTGVVKKGQFLSSSSYSLHLGLAKIGGKGRILELEFDDATARDKWETAVNAACGGGASSGGADASGLQRRMTTMGIARRTSSATGN